MKFLKPTMIIFAALVAVLIGFGMAQVFRWSWPTEFGVADYIMSALLLIFCVLIVIGMCGHKFDIKKLGSYFLHFGFVLFLIGCLLFEITGEYVIVSTYSHSGPYYEIGKEDGERLDLGFELKLGSFTVEYYPPVYEVVEVDGKGKQTTVMEEITWDENGYFDFGEYGRINAQSLSNGDGTFQTQITLADGVYAFTSSVPKTYILEVFITEDGKAMKTEQLKVNETLRVNGFKIYLMSYERDSYGDKITLLFKKDIGEPFSTAGLIFVMVGTAFHCLVYPIIKDKKIKLPLKAKEVSDK